MSQYNNLTDKELGFSYWYVTHKYQLLSFLIGTIFVVGIVLGLYAIAQFAVHFFVDKPKIAVQNQELLLHSQIITSQQAVNEQVQDMQVLDVQVIPTNSNKYDIFVPITNPNNTYYALFEYQFLTVNGETEWKKGFLLPGQSLYLHELAYESEQNLKTANVNIRNFNWEKQVNVTEIFEKAQSLIVSNNTYTPATESTPSKVSFTIDNDSAYTYKDVGFFVVGSVGSSVLGVNYIQIDELNAGETQDLEVAWFDNLGGVSTVDIIPEIDLLNPRKILRVR